MVLTWLIIPSSILIILPLRPVSLAIIPPVIITISVTATKPPLSVVRVFSSVIPEIASSPVVLVPEVSSALSVAVKSFCWQYWWLWQCLAAVLHKLGVFLSVSISCFLL